MLDRLSQYERDKAKPKDESWRNGPRISMEDMLKLRGFERMKPGELHGKVQPAKESAAKPQAHVFTFGKYRGRSIIDVFEENAGYVKWAVREVTGFRQKAIAAGIEEEELE